MGRKSSTLLKERLKVLKKAGYDKVSEEELDIKEQIADFKSKIIRCECDLNMFPNNKLIFQKIDRYKELIIKLEQKNE